jgi:transcription antitermination factor NusG
VNHRTGAGKVETWESQGGALSLPTVGEFQNREVSSGAAWYALYTRHQHEKSVGWSLAARGIEVFLPLYEEIRNWSDRRKKLNVPLFPCYVFVHSSLDRRAEILMTAGVHGFVSIDNHPAAISPTEIENVRAVARLARIEPHPFLRYGDWVRVKSGPFHGIEAYLLRRKGHAKLVLSVEILQKSVAVEIDAGLTERISRARTPTGNGFIDGRAKCYGGTA